jgi:cellulose synthase/poly-beta-1,6-N-acetylglucosamine synthase-like glycosyltransferase
MAIVALKSKPKNKDYSFQPFVSIIVPTYNEEKVIEVRKKNLVVLDYPKDKYEIIVVDSGSTDKTTEIVEKLIEKHNPSEPNLRLIKEEERKGKASAINFGKKHTKGEIVLVTDANSIFDKNVLKEMMPHFKNPKIGAVGGRYCVANPENPLAASESFYWDLEYLMRKGESFLDSACLFHGEINAWRKNLVDADTRMISEDLDMCIKIRRNGYKIEYEPNARVHEPSATTAEDQIKQRKRTSIGTIQNMFKHFGYFLPPRNLYSFLIFQSHKSLAMLSPFILLTIPILYIAAWDIGIVIMHFVLTLFIFAGMFALLMFLKSNLTKGEKIKPNFSIFFLAKIIYYVLLNEYLILLAWKDFIFGKYSVLWEKAESARG